jgi:hypothetical protein
VSTASEQDCEADVPYLEEAVPEVRIAPVLVSCLWP